MKRDGHDHSAPIILRNAGWRPHPNKGRRNRPRKPRMIRIKTSHQLLPSLVLSVLSVVPTCARRARMKRTETRLSDVRRRIAAFGVIKYHHKEVRIFPDLPVTRLKLTPEYPNLTVICWSL